MRLEHDVLICQHRVNRGEAECGARIYFVNFKHGLIYVAEVSVPECLHMRDACEDREAVLRYLRGLSSDGRAA